MPPDPRDGEPPVASRTAEPRNASDPAAGFTVVVPTRNRPEALARCLRALLAQTLPPREIVVVDDGGEAPLGDVLAGFSVAPVRLLRQSHRGPAAARNAGALAASADYVAFVDDDCEPSAEWLERLAARLARDAAVMVGGRSIDSFGGNLFSATSQSIVDHLYDFYDADPQNGGFVATNNLAVRRDLLLAIGGLDGSFPRAAGEDRDLCRRWRECGRRIVIEPAALLRHGHRLGLRSFLRQHWSYGRGAFRFDARLRQRTGAREGKPLAFYLLLVIAPFDRDRSWRGAAMTALALASQAAVVAGYLRERLARVTMRAELASPPAADPASEP